MRHAIVVGPGDGVADLDRERVGIVGEVHDRNGNLRAGARLSALVGSGSAHIHLHCRGALGTALGFAALGAVLLGEIDRDRRGAVAVVMQRCHTGVARVR